MKIYLLSALVSFGLSFLFCLGLIPILRRFKAGQNILVYVKEHKGKSGTPTMGGLAFIAAAVIAAAIFIHRVQNNALRTPILCLAVGVSYMAIGLLDDYLKMAHHQNLGLRAWQKILYQGAVAFFCGIYCYRAGLTNLYLPFLNRMLKLGWIVIPWVVFLFLATVNAVNLTDGLDGLAAGSSIPFFIAIGILILQQKGQAGMSLISFCLSGALLAYLVFNSPPASVFMGDTGSLALGGFAAALTAFTGNGLYLAVVGACFVLSVISVIIQVIYYKVTRGKRVFLMAPIHHHFQQKGYSETKISYVYFLITLLLGLVCILTA
ncbi:MAG: phospho-N-acetylmuramoyl-pentapeptide-transferase [Clostridiales bacterium]|nr:phospho-N-acetylmuramoyl-pentapeptide-transferase [Clostridiales bacterium]